MNVKIKVLASLIFCCLAVPLWAQLPPPEEPPEELSPEEIEKLKGDLGEEVYRIVAKGEVDLNYVFAESPDTFIVTYKFRLEGQVKNQVDILKGAGQITTGIEGSLAKWPTGECALNVSVGEFPYEIVFNKVGEELVRVDIRLHGEILEKWESDCSFVDCPGCKFHTTGTPEQWVMRALRRPFPSFTDLNIPIDRLHKETSTMDFVIEPFIIPDPPLGSAELQGKGIIQIIPEAL